jgi:hypothetical protein
MGVMVALWCTLAVMQTGCASKPADINPKTGFRDIVWDALLSDLPDLEVLPRGKGRWKWAVHDAESLEIGKVPVNKIEYLFIDDAFAGVDAEFAGLKTFGLLVRQFESDFGPPAINNRKMKMLAWKQDGTTILLRYYRKQNIGTIKYMQDKSVNN